MPATWRRQAGNSAECLIDYFTRDWLLVVDESHVTCSQLHACYNGDQARKRCADSTTASGCPAGRRTTRLQGEEILGKATPDVFGLGHPRTWELERQVVGPGGPAGDPSDGRADPVVEVRPQAGQVDDLLGEIRVRASARNAA